MTAYARLVAALESRGRVKPAGQDRVVAQCPAHPDDSPSLAVRGIEGQALVYCHAGCATRDVVAALDWSMRDLYDDQQATYRYESGRVVHRGYDTAGRKRFRQSGDTSRVELYHLDQLRAAGAGAVFLVEGEKDVHAIEAAGGIATTAPMGAANVAKCDLSPLHGRDVIAIADNDLPGLTWAGQLRDLLAGRVASLRFGQAKTGNDAADHIAAGYGLRDWVPLHLDPPAEVAEVESSPPHAVPQYPPVTGRLAELVAARGGLPAGLVAGAGLAAVAAVLRGAEVRIAGGWWERPILWVPLLAPRGAGKTPALDLALRPVRDLDEAAHRGYLDEMAMWLDTPKKERGPKPPDPTVLVGDLTLEHLARRLAETDGYATLAHDELSMILRSLGEYKRGGGGDRGRVLSLWSGQAWRYQRVTGATDILVSRPTVSIVGTLQPHLHHLLGGEEDGLRPRWLPHLASLDPVGQDDGGIGETPKGWTAALTSLHAARERRTWTLGGDAFGVWSTARRRWKAAAGGDETATTSAALVKGDIQAARVALVLAELANPGAGGDLPAAVMTEAVAIVDYAMSCWRALPEQNGLGLSRRTEVLDRAVERLRDWLESHGGSASRRRLLRAAVAGCRTASDLDAVIARWDETYPGTVRTEATGGRPAVVVHAPTPRAGGSS